MGDSWRGCSPRWPWSPPVIPSPLELGYDSPSAFAAMFKRTLGAPPSRYFARTSGMLNA
jgi:hypothetical protein